jgi:hypothetical protein
MNHVGSQNPPDPDPTTLLDYDLVYRSRFYLGVIVIVVTLNIVLANKICIEDVAVVITNQKLGVVVRGNFDVKNISNFLFIEKYSLNIF